VIVKMKVKFFKYVFLTVFVIFYTNTFAQMVTVRAHLDSSGITIGDQVRLTIEVKTEPGISVQFPVFSDKLTDKIEILNTSSVDSSWSKEEQKAILRKSLLITVFDSGLYVIPPIPVSFFNQTISDTIQTSPAYLTVYPFQVDTTGIIRDIKAIEKAPLSFMELFPFIIGLIGVAMIIWFIFYYLKKKKKNEPVFIRQKPEEPAHLIALRELDKLRAEKLWQKGQTKLYYSKLTEIIRRYIEKRFEIIAMEQTTDEILTEFQTRKSLHRDDFELLNNMLVLADLVKFAKADPLPDENEKHFDNAHAFVNNTKFQMFGLNVGETEEQSDIKDNVTA
jgi:hypothetical protein